MSNKPTTGIQVFTFLERTWAGKGRGAYPTVTSFDYREKLTFTRRDEKILAYEQRTQKLYDGQTEWLESHWENGFIRILDNSELELTSAQIGRVEVLAGAIASNEKLFLIHFMRTKHNKETPRIS